MAPSSPWIRASPAWLSLFSANPFGLHDVHGNVWEWVEDRRHSTYEGAPSDGSPWLEGNNSAQVLRGGSWYGAPRNLRAAIRSGVEPTIRVNYFGFRVGRTLIP
jgi:formylglycine-generating enzyme required for sulfatase activity